MTDFTRRLGTIVRGQDFWSGALFIILGVTAFATGLGYRMGTASRMGPGYFPLMLSALLVILGTIIVAVSTRTRGEDVSFGYLRPGLIVLGAVVMFALLIKIAGLFLTAFAVVFVAAHSTRDARTMEAVIVSLVLATSSCILFVGLLKQQIALWPI